VTAELVKVLAECFGETLIANVDGNIDLAKTSTFHLFSIGV
ncbi:unnamed protein product, partial [Acidithrix sp. C25]